jgi:hypothetical protein
MQKIERIRAILKGRHRIDRHITSGPISREPIVMPRILPKPLSTPTKISTSIKGGNVRVRRADTALTAGINAGQDRPRKKGLWGSGGSKERVVGVRGINKKGAGRCLPPFRSPLADLTPNGYSDRETPQFFRIETYNIKLSERNSHFLPIKYLCCIDNRGLPDWMRGHPTVHHS